MVDEVGVCQPISQIEGGGMGDLSGEERQRPWLDARSLELRQRVGTSRVTYVNVRVLSATWEEKTVGFYVS